MSSAKSHTAVVNQSPTVRVVRSLREWISGGEWREGEKLPAEMALVERLHASRGTIRTALAQLTAEGLVVDLPGRGRKSCGRIVAPAMRPASLLAKTVGVIKHGSGALADDPVLYCGGRAELAVGAAATQAIHAAGLHVLSINSQSFLESEVDQLARGLPFGLIATNQPSWSPRIRSSLERLANAGVNIVTTGHDSDLAMFDCVTSDHETGAYDLTAWLIARGHRRIAEITTGNPSLSWMKARRRGHIRALREASLEPLPRVVASHVELGRTRIAMTSEASTRLQASRELRESFERRVRQIAGFVAGLVLGKDPVDAIMAANDWDASLVLGACRLLGVEPNTRVAVVGYDDWLDTEEREWEPAVPIATVDKRNPDIGREAVRLLIDRVEGKLPPERQVRLVKPTLVEVGKTPGN